jgi:response regulator RpfG family c-di-GMP phosphodiesterase
MTVVYLIVLLVDDEAPLLKAMARQLGACQIITAESVKDALALVRTEKKLDVVISDYNLGDGTGIEVLVEVKHRHPNARRLLVSGDTGVIPAGANKIAHVIAEKNSPELATLLKSINNGNV